MNKKVSLFQITLIAVFFILSCIYIIFPKISVFPKIEFGSMVSLLTILLFVFEIFTLFFLSYGCSLIFMEMFFSKKPIFSMELITGFFSLFTYALVIIALPENLTEKTAAFIYLFATIIFSITIILILIILVKQLKMKYAGRNKILIFFNGIGVFFGSYCLMAMAYRNIHGETGIGFFVLFSGLIASIISVLLTSKYLKNLNVPNNKKLY